MLPIRTIEAGLAKIHSVDGATVVRARIQHLSVKGFPPGHHVGKARRSAYSLADAYAYALWFALADAFVQFSVAVEIVGDCWPELIRMMLAAARPSLVSQPISWGTDPIAVITPQALLGAGPAHARAPSMLWQFRIRGRADALDTQDGACAARILLDVGMLYRRLIETLTSHDISTGLLDAEIDALLMRDGWMPGDGARCNSEPEPIVRPMTVRRRGDRLVEADYFFSRSLAVLEQMGDGGCGGGERSLRYLRYIGDPAPRERWKAWLRLAGTDIPFAWAFAAVARAVGSEDCLGFPETFITGAEAMLNRAGLDSLAKRIAVLQQTARLGKELEIAEA